MDPATPAPAELSPLRRAARAVARNLGWLLASRGVLAVLSLIYLALAARTLGIADFGRFALITGAAQTIAVLVGFQTWQVVVRYGIDHVAAGNGAALARLSRAALALDAASALVGIVLAAGVIGWFGDMIGITPDLARATLAFAAVQLISIRTTPLGLLRLRDRFALSALADSVTPVTRLAGAGAAALFAPNVIGFLIAWGAAEIATAAAYWLILQRTGDLALFARPSHPGDLAAENPGLWRFVASTNLNATLGLSAKQLPLLLVGGYVGPAAAGAFRLALQLANALAKLSQLLARAAFPEVIRLAREASATHLARMLGRIFAASSAAAVAILGVVALIGRPVLLLVGGPEFSDAYGLLVWLAAAGCIDLAIVSFEPVLLAINRAMTALAARIVAVAAQIAVTLALLPVMGALGASIGVVVGSAAAALLLGLAVVRYAGRTPP